MQYNHDNLQTNHNPNYETESKIQSRDIRGQTLFVCFKEKWPELKQYLITLLQIQNSNNQNAKTDKVQPQARPLLKTYKKQKNDSTWPTTAANGKYCLPKEASLGVTIPTAPLLLAAAEDSRVAAAAPRIVSTLRLQLRLKEQGARRVGCKSLMGCWKMEDCREEGEGEGERAIKVMKWENLEQLSDYIYYLLLCTCHLYNVQLNLNN